MPNRILRDWTDSFIIDELDVNTERFFVRLIMKVDDYGRLFSDVRLLRANLFPLKTDIRDSDISRWLAACEKAGLIAIYNVASKEFLQITNFKQTLRQKKEKYPSPDTCYADATHVSSIRSHEKKRKETETETEDEHPNNFTLMPKVEDVGDFPNHKIISTIELLKITCQADISEKDVQGMWNVFKVQNLTGSKFYKDLDAVHSHFMNWVTKKDYKKLNVEKSNESIARNIEQEKSRAILGY